MSHRTLTMLLTFVAFTVVMAGVGWMLKQVVPSFADWAIAGIGLGWASTILVAVVAAASVYAYRAEMAARSDRSF